jgi:predicted Zn-ribbon and HTH transcriptional regulator
MPDEPPSRATTSRERLAEELQRGFATVRTLSQRTGLTEERVRDHLERLARGLEKRGGELEREAPRCRRCGRSFDGPDPFAAPSRCPSCHSDRVDAPRFRAP